MPLFLALSRASHGCGVALGLPPGSLIGPRSVSPLMASDAAIARWRWRGSTPRWPILDGGPSVYALTPPIVSHKDCRSARWCAGLVSLSTRSTRLCKVQSLHMVLSRTRPHADTRHAKAQYIRSISYHKHGAGCSSLRAHASSLMRRVCARAGSGLGRAGGPAGGGQVESASALRLRLGPSRK